MENGKRYQKHRIVLVQLVQQIINLKEDGVRADQVYYSGIGCYAGLHIKEIMLDIELLALLEDLITDHNLMVHQNMVPIVRIKKQSARRFLIEKDQAILGNHIRLLRRKQVAVVLAIIALLLRVLVLEGLENKGCIEYLKQKEISRIKNSTIRNGL